MKWQRAEGQTLGTLFTPCWSDQLLQVEETVLRPHLIIQTCQAQSLETATSGQFIFPSGYQSWQDRTLNVFPITFLLVEKLPLSFISLTDIWWSVWCWWWGRTNRCQRESAPYTRWVCSHWTALPCHKGCFPHTCNRGNLQFATALEP